MRRFIYIITLMALVLSACGGSTVSTTDGTVDTPTATENPVSSSSPTTDVPDSGDTTDSDDGPDAAESTTTEATAAAVTDFDGPAAADFSINLAGGRTFSLSEEARPVYLVFWAEW